MVGIFCWVTKEFALILNDTGWLNLFQSLGVSSVRVSAIMLVNVGENYIVPNVLRTTMLNTVSL